MTPIVLGCESDPGDRDPSEGMGMFPDVEEPMDPAEPADPGEYLMGIDAEFAAAAAEFDVPVDLLKAVGYVESQWQMVAGEVEFDGIEPAHGAMALRGSNLTRGATLIGADVDKVKTDRSLNIRAAAALLREKADAQNIDRTDLGAWAPAIVELSEASGIERESTGAMSYVHQNVYTLIANGLEVTDLAGNVISEIEPHPDVFVDYPHPNGPVLATNPDYNGAIWRTSPNRSNRPAGDGGKIRVVIIHTCEGSYAGCHSWLANPKAGVSAHYVIKEDGSEITQLVKESDRAWHIGSKYNPDFNGGKHATLKGSSNNNFTVGIEHAGFGSQASWNANLIDQSARLVCDITKRQGIPIDKFHILGHGQLQPHNRTDPGKNWPWATYFNKISAMCNGNEPEPEPPPAPPPPKPQDPPPDNPPPDDPPPDDPPPDDPPPDDPPDDPPPQKPDPAEIIVDSFNGNNALIADFYAPGSWTSTAATPGYYGNNYLFASTTNVDDGAEFWFYLNNPGSKKIDVWFTPGTNRSAKTPIVAFDGTFKEIGFQEVNMQSGGKAWTAAGTYTFPAGWNMIMVSRWAPAGSVVIADAVRVRD